MQQNSLQVTNWKSEEVIAFRNTDSQFSADVIFNSYDKYEFATCGYQNISVWQVNGRSLIRKEWIKVQKNEEGETPFFTCLAYIHYQVYKNNAQFAAAYSMYIDEEHY